MKTREIGAIPVDVLNTIILLHGMGRNLMEKKILGELPFDGFPNCHTLARIYERLLSKSIVRCCDGGLIVTHDRASLLVFHSWLQFIRYPDFGIDVAPIWSVPLFTMPNLLFFDDHWQFKDLPLPKGNLKGIEERIRFYEEPFKRARESILK